MLLVSDLIVNITNTCTLLFFVKTRFDVYETLCPQQMLVHKGGQIKNWSGDSRDVIPTNCSVKLFKEQFKVQICKGRLFEKNKITFFLIFTN